MPQSYNLRALIRNVCLHQGLPCRIAATIGRQVLEIAVLHKLCIKAAVGAIVDVLEKYAYELVGYGLGIGRARTHAHIHPSKAAETLCIVLGLLPVESLAAAAAVQIGFNTVNNPSVDRLYVSSHTAPLDCGRIRAQSYRRIYVAGQVVPRGEIPLRLPLGKIGSM